MNIIVRRIDRNYIGLKVEFDNSTHDLGIFSEKEAKQLAEELESASDDLLSGWDNPLRNALKEGK